MDQVDGGDFKEGLQLRLMDPSTGGPHSEWYKFKGSEIAKIQKADQHRLALLSQEIPAARQMTKDAVYLAMNHTSIDVSALTVVRSDTAAQRSPLPPVVASRGVVAVRHGSPTVCCAASEMWPAFRVVRTRSMRIS